MAVPNWGDRGKLRVPKVNALIPAAPSVKISDIFRLFQHEAYEGLTCERPLTTSVINAITSVVVKHRVGYPASKRET
jgi:hypothetical protein